MSTPVIYLPVCDPNLILEGCETLLKGVLERLIEKQINGTGNYSSETGFIRIRITRIELNFTNV